MAAVQYERVSKLFESITAVDDLTLDVTDGEFMVLVGPSGCGKTTSLRMLAGFERPTYGTLYIDGHAVNTMPPKDRDLAMVFQSYALYPHMTVYKNLSFGMRVRHESRKSIRPQVEEVAKLLEIEALLDRRPSELSGGQRQRVALGRALLRRPKAFLLDEPLSNLDAALRVHMRAELKRLHDRFGVTSIYVTHDQVEAMTMGSRIALMNAGQLQQVDTPERIYDRPANVFAASFVGSPKMNLLPARLTGLEGTSAIDWLGGQLPVEGEAKHALDSLGHDELIAGIRPEDLRWAEDAPASHTVRVGATIDVVEPLGSETFVVVRVGEETLTARFPPRLELGPGAQVELAIRPSHVHLFDARTEQNVLSVTPLAAAGDGPAPVDSEASFASRES